MLVLEASHLVDCFTCSPLLVCVSDKSNPGSKSERIIFSLRTSTLFQGTGTFKSTESITKAHKTACKCGENYQNNHSSPVWSPKLLMKMFYDLRFFTLYVAHKQNSMFYHFQKKIAVRGSTGKSRSGEIYFSCVYTMITAAKVMKLCSICSLKSNLFMYFFRRRAGEGKRSL